MRRGFVEAVRPKLAEWTREDHWLTVVNQPLAAAPLDGLRQSVGPGAPYGVPDWIAALVKQAGLESTVRRRGRPTKLAAAAPDSTNAG